MTARPALANLDAIDWPALSHAYGSAEDTPDLLRRLAAADPARRPDDDEAGDDNCDDCDDDGLTDAESALESLWTSICHQGSVYPATVAAVPFLAEIAAAGVATTHVLHLIGAIAEAADPRAVGDADPVRAAVAACFDVLSPLLESPDADVREAVVYVFAYSGPVDRVRPVLLEIWRTETDSGMRAEVLHALIRVDQELAADLAGEVLAGDGDDAALRISSALAWIHSGRAADERVLAAAMTPLPEDGPDFAHWCMHHGDLFTLIVNELAEHHGGSAAGDFLARALIAAHDGTERAEIADNVAAARLDAARTLMLAYRDVAEVLIEPITNLLGYPALNNSVFGLLAIIGPDAFTPRVRNHLIMLSHLDDDFADHALSYLFNVGDPLAPALLGRFLAVRPRALSIASGSMARPEPGVVAMSFDAELFEAIRRRLTELADAADREMPEEEDLFAEMRRTNEPIQLARILGGWGEAAISAAPELARMLPISTIPAARALAAIGAPGSAPHEAVGAEVVCALHAVADRGDVSTRIALAEAIRALTGDPEPLLEVVLSGLGQGRAENLRDAARAAADLPDHAATLVPRLTEALLADPPPGASLPAHSARIELVRTLYRLGGRSERAIPVLRESLGLAGEMFTGWTVADAADAAAELGPEARDLLPELGSALEDHVACPAAAQALLAIDPAGPWATTGLEALALHLVKTLTHGRAASAQQRALDTLEALGPELTPAAIDALRELAEQDTRILAALPDAELVRADENARDRIRALLTR